MNGTARGTGARPTECGHAAGLRHTVAAWPTTGFESHRSYPEGNSDCNSEPPGGPTGVACKSVQHQRSPRRNHSFHDLAALGIQGLLVNTYECEGCGAIFNGTAEAAFAEGWDTLERFVSHCTCPNCSITVNGMVEGHNQPGAAYGTGG